MYIFPSPVSRCDHYNITTPIQSKLLCRDWKISTVIGLRRTDNSTPESEHREIHRALRCNHLQSPPEWGLKPWQHQYLPTVHPNFKARCEWIKLYSSFCQGSVDFLVGVTVSHSSIKYSLSQTCYRPAELLRELSSADFFTTFGTQDTLISP